MDLGAFVQIDDLSKIMTENNINVPRLRGLRRMADETEDLVYNPTYDKLAVDTVKELVDSGWVLDSCVFIYDGTNERRRKKYISNDDKVLWENLHGKKRRLVKFAIKRKQRRIKAQATAWNKYKGRDDVLYIHARIGGNNWVPYDGPELEHQEWFLEKVDDWFDDTYCDIYAKIKVTENT